MRCSGHVLGGGPRIDPPQKMVSSWMAWECRAPLDSSPLIELKEVAVKKVGWMDDDMK